LVVEKSYREFMQMIVDGYNNGRFTYKEGAWGEY